MIGRKWMVSTLLLLNQLGLILAYDYSLLKKCKDSGFCLRNREYAEKIQASNNSYYSIDGSSVVYASQNHTVKCNVIKHIPRNGGEDGKVVLPFTLDMLEGSKVRFVLDEERAVHDVPNVLTTERSNTAMEFAFEYPEKQLGRSGGDIEVKKPNNSEKDKITIEDHGSQVRVVLYLNKFLIEVYHRDVLQITVNERSYLNLEHWRPKDQQEANLLPEESTFDMFEDSFIPPSNDTKPFGPEAVALDITFHNYQNVYGIPDHANSLRLKDTSAGDPYRLYNADLPEYELNATYPLYGSIPFMISARPGAAAGIFWVNAADTFVDVKYEGRDARTHWMSEAGKIDVVLFFGDEPAEVTELYTGLTGRPALPQLSALGYHQSRWNYNDEQDVLTVVHEMNKAEIPMDYVWLDLDYTDERKYFTWKPDAFPDPLRLYKKVEGLAKNLVILIDPHLKVNYNVSNMLMEHNGVMLDQTGAPFQAQCWPGESVWVDSVSPAGRDTWASLYVSYLEGVKNLAIWNDMNEPAVFDGTESTARKDVILGGGYELRALHNLYGMSVHEATYKGLKERYGEDGLRPFLLTRAHFAGSQRTAGTWTGDNGASWGYLSISIPMVLSSNIVGMPLNGADIGGFFNNPDPELLARWYQTAVWYPFFRGHANKGTKRREPFLAEEPYKSVIRDAINLRYSLLPTFYTAFHESNTTGIPIMNPMFYVKPELEEVYSIQDQFYLGQQGILVKPVVSNNTDAVDFFFPPGIFYDYKTLEPSVFRSGTYKKVHAPLDKIPIFLEGGHIIARKNRHRQSTKLMKNDPYTLVVAPNETGEASGNLYIDDGETFAYRDGNYLKINYHLTPGILEGNIINVSDHFGGLNIEQIVIAKNDQIKLGSSVVVEQDGQKWTVAPIEDEHYYSIPHPTLVVDKEWKITF